MRYSPTLGRERTKKEERRMIQSEAERTARYQLIEEEDIRRWVKIRTEVRLATRPNEMIGRARRPRNTRSSDS